MNIYLFIIVGVLIGEYLLESVVSLLNVKAASLDLPQEFVGVYDAAKYAQAQAYVRENTRFSFVKDTVVTFLTVSFILGGGFNFVDTIARSAGFNALVTGLLFAGILMVVSQLLEIPFSVYHTFVIEERFGFNRTTPKTFITDLLKGLGLGVVLGGIVFAGIIWFFSVAGSLAWVYCWLGVVLFQLFVTFIAPVVILPLFNKFTPLADGELKEAICRYADSQRFRLKGIFTIDASKRSTKSNAFFTGLGTYKRIALFDTLIARHTTDELVSVLAHEIGHFKKRHIVKGIFLSVMTTGLMFFILTFFINNQGLFAAFKMSEVSIYASLIFFGFLYTPINLVFSVVRTMLSRKYEYEADRFGVETFQKPEASISALKKLTVENLSNLTPHPLKVFLHYSHPPVLERIKAIRALA